MVEKIIALIEYFMIFSIFFLLYLLQPIKTDRVIYVPNGSLNYTIKKLQESGIQITNFDKYLLSYIGTPQSGWIDLKSNNMSRIDFLYRLTHSKAALKKITIVPGETDYYIYKNIAKKMGFESLRCNNIPTSFLYPNSYYIPYGFTPKQVCGYLYQISLKQHKKLAQKIFGYWSFSNYYHYLIIASIIQKEAKDSSDMKLISSVIYNRLKKGMRLQMDGTLNYGKYSHTKVTSQMIKKDNSPYNTYKHNGLPSKPICVVSQEAIVASIFPAKTDYLYFVKVNGEHKFTKSYREHLKSVKK